MGEKGKRHYVLIKDFSILMYDHTLHHITTLLLLLYTSLSTNEILKRHIKYCFKQRVNKGLRC